MSRGTNKIKWIKRIAVSAILVGVGVWTATRLGPAPIPVEIGAVVRGPLVVTVDGLGKTRMKERYTVFAPTYGELSRIALRPGDPVVKGQVIAEIEPSLSQPLDARSRAETTARLAATKASYAEAARNVERAEIAADLAQKEVERMRRLVESGTAPTRALEVAEADAKTRTAELELAKLAVERARLETAAVSVTLRDPNKKRDKSGQQVQVSSPSSGTVLAVHTESAGPVQPGAPLIDIGDSSTVELVVDLPTQFAVRVTPGAKVQIDGIGDGKPRRGKVRLIEPSAYTKITALGVEEQRVNVIVTMTDPPPVLGDGFAADAHIEVQKTGDVLKIPSGAIFREKDGFAVFTVQKGRAQLVRVKAKNRNADEVEIEGLKQGDKVIIHPSDKIKDGVLAAAEGVPAE
jgi:HlyD family secretion protein